MVWGVCTDKEKQLRRVEPRARRKRQRAFAIASADVTVKVPGVAQNLFLLSTGASQGIDS